MVDHRQLRQPLQLPRHRRPRPGQQLRRRGRVPRPRLLRRSPDQTAGDYWPGQYSRTSSASPVPTTSTSCAACATGRVWVDHGRPGQGRATAVRAPGARPGARHAGRRPAVPRGTASSCRSPSTLAGPAQLGAVRPGARPRRRHPGRGRPAPARRPRHVPRARHPGRAVLGHLGATGADRARSSRSAGSTAPFYVRLRGTDGKRSAPGLLGAAVDPAGPALDVVGDADPWDDLWFYTNPIFVTPL